MIVANLEWAHKIAGNVAGMLPTWFTTDDLMAPAEIALIDMAAKYDPSRRVPFRAFAQQRIYGACFDSVRRREYRERAHYALKDQHIDTRQSEDGLIRNIDLEAIWQKVESLPPKHCIVMQLLYREGLTGVEVSQKIGLGEPRVSQLPTEALAMLRTMCERMR